MQHPTSSKTVSRWLSTGTWTVLDQGLFAGSNFVVNVLLARWLTPEEYGAYTVAYTLFLLLGTIHGGLLIEPMLVFGSGRFEGRLRHYLRLLLSGHVWFSVFAGGALALTAVGFALHGEVELARALAVLAVAQAAILFLWLIRGACYIRTQPRLAAIAGMGYAVILLAGAAFENHLGHLNVTTALEWMTVASVLSGGWLVWKLGIPFGRTRNADLEAEARQEHRTYGKWAAATGGMEWLHGFLPFLILPLWAGLEGTGALRALFNFILPVLHVYHAFGNLIVPLFVRARAQGTLRRTVTVVTTGMLVLSIGYALTLDLFGAPLVHWLYDGKYDGYTHLLWLVGILPVGVGFVTVAQSILRAMEQPKYVFFARTGAALAASTIGVALVWVLGVAGALLSSILAAGTEGVLMLLRLRKSRDLDPTPPAPARSGARKRVLMVAYACSPGRGSEPGQGWAFARGVAAYHDVCLLTYAGFRTAIEAELAVRPVPGLEVVYHRLPLEHPPHWRDGVDREGVFEQLHYYLWHRTAARLARALHRRAPFDLTHHVSFMRYWSPSAAAAPDAPFVWGPVGGGESAPAVFYPSFGRAGQRAERLRDRARWLAHYDPAVRRTAARAGLALAATPETAAAMTALGASGVRVGDGVALEADTITTLNGLPVLTVGPIRFISIGRLLHWKGYAFALDAFAALLARRPDLAEARYTIIGEGPDRDRLVRKAAALGLTDRVAFLGALPRAEALERLSDAHVFLHPSFHDCGGYATLEAMAAGRPVVCLALGGPSVQVDDEVGIAVEAVHPDQVVRDLAAAMERLALDADLRRRLSEAGRARVRERFEWSQVIARTVALYEQLVPPRHQGDGQAEGLPVWAAPDPADTSP